MAHRLFQKATSGIVSLPTPDGERIIPASRRPDGSIRPARRVRAGFTPEEDQQRFRSRRVVERSLPSGFVVGRDDPSSISSSNNNSSSQSRPTRTADGSWHKQHTGTGRAAAPVKSAWDDDSDDSTAAAAAATNISHGRSQHPTTGVAQSGLEDASKAQRKNEKRREKRMERTREQQEQLMQESVEAAVRDRTSKAATAAGSSEAAAEEVEVHDPLRKARALRKKIRQAEELKRRRDVDGAQLLPQEASKVDRIEELQVELDRLSISTSE